MPQPTLPNVELDEFSPVPRSAAKSNYASSYATSTTKNDGYGVPGLPPDLNGSTPDYPPPMPLYDPYAYGSPQPLPSYQYDQHSVYPPSERQPHGGEYANSSTHIAGAGESTHNVDQYYTEANGGHKRGTSQYLALHTGETGAHRPDEQNRASVYSNNSIGLAYDVEEPRTPHRRTASGTGAIQARQREEDAVLEQQAHDGYSYRQQWPGYSQEQHPSQPGHGRRRSRGQDGFGHAM